MTTHRFAVGTENAGIDQIVVTEDGLPVSSDEITDTLVDLSLEQLFSLADDIMANPIYEDTDSLNDETESSESLVTLETQASSDNALEKLFTQVDEILSHPNYSEKIEHICSSQVAGY